MSNKRSAPIRTPRRRGVFCLEADWWGSPAQHASVRPVLELLAQPGVAKLSHVHHDVATRGELDFYLKQWGQRRFDPYSILYLAFHGSQGAIHLGDGRRNESVVELDELGDVLEGRCKNRIVYFGSCDTLDVHGRELNRFLARTGALGVCGYRHEADWIGSAAFELVVLDYLADAKHTRPSLLATQRQILKAAGGLARQFQFRLKVHP